MDRRAVLVWSVPSVLAVPTLLAAQGSTTSAERLDRAAGLGWEMLGRKPPGMAHAIVIGIVLVVFLAMAGVIALRHRESIFDTIEFEGMRLFKKAAWGAVILIIVAFVALAIFNNLRR